VRHLADGSALNTHHFIKVVALLIMTIDHLGAFLWPDLLWLRAIGRVGFPVWFFLVGHATRYHTGRELVLWALILTLASPLLGLPFFLLNALITIIACQWVLRVIERRDSFVREPYALLFACVLFGPGTFALTEYGTLGLLYALMGYAVRTGQVRRARGRICALMAFATYLAALPVSFAFSPAQYALAILGTAAITYYLAHFVHRPLSFSHAAFLRAPIVFLSRISLQYYVLHRCLLQALGLLRGTLKFGFHWF